MRPGREMDAQIASLVFGHKVWAQAKTLFENAEKGDRPLRHYSKEMEWAWEVVEKLKMTLIPIDSGGWFAFTGPLDLRGWESPQAVLQFLDEGQFDGCGAAVGEKAPQVICEAALKAIEKRTALTDETPISPTPDRASEQKQGAETSCPVVANNDSSENLSPAQMGQPPHQTH